MRFLGCFLVLLGVVFVHYSKVAAQNAPTPSASPLEQALSRKLMAELDAGLSCNAGLISAQQNVATLQADLAKAKARIAELEHTAEPQK